MKCRRCDGDKTVENDSTGREYTCGRCNGTGVEPPPILPTPGSLYTYGGGKIYGVMCWPGGKLQIETPNGLKDVPEGTNVWEFIKEQHPLDFPDTPRYCGEAN